MRCLRACGQRLASSCASSRQGGKRLRRSSQWTSVMCIASLGLRPRAVCHRANVPGGSGPPGWSGCGRTAPKSRLAPSPSSDATSRGIEIRLVRLEGCLTPCMPCSFGLLPFPRSGPYAQPDPLPSSDRDYPLDTAGARRLRRAGGTAGENDDAPPGGDGSSSARG
jgi:hypothetical protein